MPELTQEEKDFLIKMQNDQIKKRQAQQRYIQNKKATDKDYDEKIKEYNKQYRQKKRTY